MVNKARTTLGGCAGHPPSPGSALRLSGRERGGWGCVPDIRFANSGMTNSASTAAGDDNSALSATSGMTTVRPWPPPLNVQLPGAIVIPEAPRGAIRDGGGGPAP